MNQTEIETRAAFLKRDREISQRQEAEFRFLADDSRVNENGVFVFGVEKITIEVDKYKVEIRLIQGRTGKWFHGISSQKSFGDYTGSSFAPSIMQALDGDPSCTRKGELAYCIERIKYIANDDLRDCPAKEKEFLSKLDALCIKENFYDVTYGLPLFQND
jgi:hypothetical protein